MSQTNLTTQSVMVVSLTLDASYASMVALIESQGSEFAASILQPKGLDLFGVGSSASEAIEDLKATIFEAYETLNKERNNLGPKLRAELKILNGVIRSNPAVAEIRKETTPATMPVWRGDSRTAKPPQSFQNSSAVAA